MVFILAGMAFAALSLTIAIHLLRKPAVSESSISDTMPQPTATTEWPHGQPEYAVEIPPGNVKAPEDIVPPGYEDLLPEARPAKKTTPRGQGEKIVIVIDDVGYNLEELQPFLDLPFPVTLAVLPGVAHSAEAAARIRASGKELILHQPMQALGGNDPGPGAIYVSMSEDEAKAALTENIDSLGEISGVNNHMGSAVTRDGRLMRVVLSLVKERGLYYLDSLTTAGTVTATVGADLAMNTWERDVFLDNSQDRQSMIDALEEGMKQAKNKGNSILIGHVWSDDLARTLMELYPRLVEEGYSLTSISKLMLEETKDRSDARAGD